MISTEERVNKIRHQRDIGITVIMKFRRIV